MGNVRSHQEQHPSIPPGLETNLTTSRMEMWIGFLATNVAPLWPLLKRSGIQKRHKGVAPGLPIELSARHRFARRRKLPDLSSYPDYSPDIDDDGYLGSVTFQRLGSRSASQEVAAHPAGIKMTTELRVTSGKASENAESEWRNASIGGVCV